MNTIRWLFYVVTVASLHANVSQAAATSLVYTAPGGVEITITAEGLSSIRVGDRQLATGGWSIFNAEHWFKYSGTSKPEVGQIVMKTISVHDNRWATVRHEYKQVDVITDYCFDGEDLTISARVENNHLAEPINVIGFRGLSFEFDGLPEGHMMTQHISNRGNPPALPGDSQGLTDTGSSIRLTDCEPLKFHRKEIQWTTTRA